MINPVVCKTNEMKFAWLVMHNKYINNNLNKSYSDQTHHQIWQEIELHCLLQCELVLLIMYEFNHSYHSYEVACGALVVVVWDQRINTVKTWSTSLILDWEEGTLFPWWTIQISTLLIDFYNLSTNRMFIETS